MAPLLYRDAKDALAQLAVGCVAALALGLTGCGGGGASSSGSEAQAQAPATVPIGDAPYIDAVTYSADVSAALPSASESAAVSHHTIALSSGTIAYTATAGHLTTSPLNNGAPAASVFYVAYVAEGQAAGTRPITFFYNGGPGSSSIWLHLGSFGPKRLVTGDPSNAPAMPFALVDNAQTLLDTTDLVFIDAVGTGLSEAIAPNTNGTFWGVDADAAVFRDFVMRYLAVNQRAASPKFLFGESYGTTRSAVLASALQAAGITLNGVVLQSSILNYNSNCGVFNINLVNCAGYVPSYGAIGAYYHLATPAPSALPSFVDAVRSYTAATYAPLENQYLMTPAAAPTAVVNQLTAFTGMRTAVWQAQFDLDPTTFQYNLLGGVLIGRYDARVNAPLGSLLAAQGDPSSTVITGSFQTAINSYLPGFLEYSAASGYVLESNAIDDWIFSHDGQALPDVIPDLATALAQNPQLKVLSLNGYHDLATPFYQTEMDLARLGPVPNLTILHYVGGHMVYLDDTSRPLEKADVAAFIHSAS